MIQSGGFYTLQGLLNFLLSYLDNLILILMCFTIMWGTLFPILSEAWDGNKIYVGASYFNQLNIPIGLVLLFLMGIGQRLSWNYTYKSILLSRFKIYVPLIMR